MFFTFFALTIGYLQPISNQELQIIPKTDFNLPILPTVSNNLHNELIPIDPCECRKCKNVVTANNIECGYQKQLNLNVLPRNKFGCGCQGQSNLLPLNCERCTCNNNIGCKCQGHSNILPVNRCGCQSQNTLILPNTCGCKRQPNFLLPISNIWYESQKPNSLVNDVECKYRLHNTILTNNIGCGCQKQQNIIPTKICGCKLVQIPRNNGCGCQNIGCKCNRQINVIPPSIDGCEYQRSLNIIPMPKTLIAYQIPSLPSENDLTISNKFPVTDLPVTKLSSELSEGLSRGKDFPRRNDLSELKSRLTEMTDLVSATAKLLSLLPKINGNNSFPLNKHGNGSITDLPVAGNDD